METASSYGDNERLSGRDIPLTTAGVSEYMARRFLSPVAILTTLERRTRAEFEVVKESSLSTRVCSHNFTSANIFFTIRPSSEPYIFQ